MSDKDAEKPSQSATHCGQILMDMFSLAAYTTIIVTLSVSISYHPMLRHVQGKDRSQAYVNNTVYTNTYITHRTPFAKYMLPENNTLVKTMDLQKHQKKQEVYKYIQDHVVGDGGVDALGKYYVSPIHTVMTLMGCYGDAHAQCYNDSGICC